jgi:hypothetical protein
VACAHSSSRSHLLFVVRLTRKDVPGNVSQNMAHLADLAGSERLGLSRASGSQNLSLCMLACVYHKTAMYIGVWR